MAERLDTVIILRNDQSTAWESADAYKLEPGEVGIGYVTRTAKDGSTTTAVIAKVGTDGETAWNDLPQIEGVLEDDLTLTYNFGRHKTSNGYVNAGGKGMTTTEWLLDALSEILNPTVNYPSASMSAKCLVEGGTSGVTTAEMGAYVTGVIYDGGFSSGSYKDAANSGTYGTTADKTSNSTGLSSSNVTWSMKNNKNSQTSTKMDDSFSFTSDERAQVTSESSTTYARVSGTATLNASGSRIPLNNVGAEYAAGKIAGFDKAGTTVKSFDVAASVSGYRKPFWGWKSTAESLTDPTKITSAQVRALGNSGGSNGDVPTSLTVPAGTKQVYIAVKAGVKSTLTVKNVTKEPATGVASTKVANAVSVDGANSYTATAYDLWYINLDAAFTGETNLSLLWT